MTLTPLPAHGGRTQWPGGWTWRPRLESWTDCDLWMVRTGRGRLETPDGTFALRAGDVFLLRPGEPYRGLADARDPASLLWIHFDWYDAQQGRVRRPEPLPPLHRRVDDPRFFATLLVRCLRHLRLPAGRPAAGLWLAAALDELDRHDRITRGPAVLDDLAERIVQDPAAFPDAAACARFCRLSARHFSRLFCQRFACPPQAWIIEQRIAQAQRLLRESEEPLKRIAERLGYADPAFFGRQFKACTGTSPAAYRRGPGG